MPSLTRLPRHSLESLACPAHPRHHRGTGSSQLRPCWLAKTKAREVVQDLHTLIHARGTRPLCGGDGAGCTRWCLSSFVLSVPAGG
eukprot:gene16971-biopygen18842